MYHLYLLGRRLHPVTVTTPFPTEMGFTIKEVLPVQLNLSDAVPFYML